MKKKPICIIVLVLLVSGSVLLPLYGEKPGSAVVEGNTTFALDLYRGLKNSKGNIFFSPYSISTALAMTYAGARGNTAKQMAGVLHFTLDQDQLHPAFAWLEALLDDVQKKGDVQLSVANALWPQEGYMFLKEYLALVKDNYGVTIEALNYKKAPEKARKIINQWVEKKTKDKIKNLIPPGVLDALTRLVLTNAIYFKGNWASQFNKKWTQDDTFYLLSGKTIQAPLMNQTQDFAYKETAELQVLELPYVGKTLSMIVLLPKKRNGLPQLEKQLAAGVLIGWTSGLRKRKVMVFLPKFKMTSQFRLSKTLISMGMRDAFGKRADFSGMDGSQWLFISAVLHKAFVDVNEEGTEAAAATAVVMSKKESVSMPPPTFRADHPFIFFIRENTTKSILFIGRVLDPTS